MRYKTILSSLIGLLGTLISHLVGDITPEFSTLFLFMVIDILTGFITASVFKSSDKTESGGLSSKAMLKGVCKKVGMLLLIIVAYRLDIILATTYVKTAVIISLLVVEILSIIENLTLMGVPIPKAITNALTVLNNKIKGEQ